MKNYLNWTKFFCDYYTMHYSVRNELTRQLGQQIEEILGVVVPWHRSSLFQDPIGNLSRKEIVNNEYRTVFDQTRYLINSFILTPLFFTSS